MAVTVMNYFDRNLISILIGDIKSEFDLSDGQIGLISGLAFAAVYSFLAIPVARFADRGRRVKVLGASLFLWSIMTSFCGFATGLGTFLLGRFGVGAGEAGGLPTTHALIADYASPRWRSTALSLTAVAGGIGVALAVSLGGYLSGEFGWRAVFWLAGLPGIGLAILVVFTIREPLPMKQRPAENTPVVSKASTFREDASELLGRRTFQLTCMGLCAVSLGVYATNLWTPTLLMRNFSMSAAELGPLYALATAPVFLIGSLAGGLLSDILSRYDKRAPLWIMAAAFLINVPLSLMMFLSTTFELALIAATASALMASVFTGPAFALIQALSGSRLRATGAAFFLLAGNFVGMGLGPFFTGSLSDALEPFVGTESLGIALSIMMIFYLAGTVLFLKSTETLRDDLTNVANAA